MSSLEPWLPAAAIFASSVLAGLLFHALLLRRFRAWAERTQTQLDDLLIDTLVGPLPAWMALGGLAGAAQAAPLSARQALLVHKGVVAAFLLSLTFALSKLASAGVREYSKGLHGSARTTGVVDNLVRGVVLVLGGLLILSNLGISITPLLGALGVGSLAVALALQDTLTNLFAGLHIVASEIVSVGDYVLLDTGQEGVVSDVGWRVTRIREGGGNDIVLPNSKLANAILTNFHRPAPDTAVAVPVSVGYGSDLEKVERVTLEIAREVQQAVPGATRHAEPALRYHSFQDSGILFKAILRADSFPDRHLLVHEFIKRLHRRYAREGIDMPFPQRVVHLKQG